MAYLTQELVQRGHEVTLFASGDSRTNARLIAPIDRAIRLNPSCRDGMAPHILMLEMVAKQARDFDIIHYHIDYLHFPLSRRLRLRHLTTLHGRLDLPEIEPIYREFSDMPLVSVSSNQRTPLSWARWAGTVHHGIPKDLLRFSDKAQGYLAFLGRICPEKRPDLAIEIARRANKPIKITAKVDKADKAYYESEIRPLLSSPHVEFVGEIGEREKGPFLGGAEALLFPIDWPEPFGLVMIEALACGTPVIAFNRGSVPEVISDGVTGIIVQDEDEAVRKIEKIDRIDRRECRRVFEKRFTSSRMALEYEALYEMLIAGDHQKVAPTVFP